DYCIMTVAYGSQITMISIYRCYGIIMTTQYQVTLVRTRLWNLSEESILGQVLGCSLKTIISPVRLALDPKHHDTGHTDSFDNSRFRKNHGTQFQSILLISYHPPQIYFNIGNCRLT